MNWGVLSPRTRRALLAGVAVAMLVMAVGLVERFRGDDDPYRFHRTRIWAASFGAAMNAPWRGTGPGQFAVAAVNLNFPLENAPLRYERSFHTPHSDALRAICEFGIPAGLAAFVAAVLFGIAVVGRRATLSAAGRGAFAALVCLAAQASVDDLSTRPALTLFGASLAGWLIAVPRRRPASRPAVLAAAFLIVAGLGVGEIAGFVAWRSVHELPRGALDASQLAALHRALDWNPMQPDSWERLAEHAEGAGRTWTADDYAAAREAAEHAMRLQPVDAFYTRGAARLAATACLSLFPFAAERDRAAQLYEQAQRLARTDATISLEEAKFLLQAGDPARARRAAEQALKIEPRSGTARLWLARAIWSEQGAAAAVQVRRLLDEAERLAPRLGEIPTSAYDAALRAVDPTSVASLRAELDGTGAASPR